MTDFAQHLLHWYHENKRSLPWRQTSDPYHIWISEIILQQTQVKQGHDYYLRFIKEFPDVQSLASASEQQVLTLWQGLGYYSRARNLHTAAKTIMNEHHGVFPSDYRHIRALKGIGAYTAAAIASFAFGKAHAVVDGNVYRFLARLNGISTPIDSSKGQKQFQELADTLLNKHEPGNHNQAVMEFGATVCKPSLPLCNACPFNGQCVAYSTGTVDQFPVKAKKTKQRNRYFNYIVAHNYTEHLYIRKRTNKDIWQNLYELPLIESERTLPRKDLAIKLNDTPKKLDQVKHQLSHQTIYASFWSCSAEAITNYFGKDLHLITPAELSEFPFSQLTINFLQSKLGL